MTPITWYLYGRSGGAKAAIDKVGVKESVSEEVAAFSDGADDIPMQSVVAEITPVQSGSGDPSPTNIRPISGRTGMTVTAANKNLAPNYAGTASTTSNGITFTYNDDGSVTLNGTATASAYSRAVDGIAGNIRRPYGTYKKPVAAFGNHYVGLFVQYQKSTSSWETVTGGGVASDTFTLDEDYPLAIRIGVTAGTTVDNYRFEPYVYPASISDTTWVSPSKTEIPVTWETEAGTIYGGTLDVVSGVLTVDKILRTLKNTDTWYLNPSWANLFYQVWQDTPAPFAAGGIGNQCMCDRYKMVKSDIGTLPSGSALFNTPLISGTRNSFGVRDAAYSTVDEFKASFTEIQLVYPLATPQTYQLTPTEVRTLLGGNTIYTDAGDVSVEYIADTKLYIDNKIAELQALVLEN